MGSTYICLDTNILFRIVTQGQPGCEVDKWNELKQLLSPPAIVLLVPEVVQLEFSKHMLTLSDHIETQTAAIADVIKGMIGDDGKKKGIWNEVHDAVPALRQALERWKTNKLSEVMKRHDDVQAVINSASASPLALTPDHFFRVRKRIIAGKVKSQTQKDDADLCIIEALAGFFAENKADDSQLLFCTENIQDFALDLADNTYSLHPELQEGLPPSQLFRNLSSLVDFVTEKHKVQQQEASKIAEALEREKQERMERLQEADRSVYINLLKRLKEQEAIVGNASLHEYILRKIEEQEAIYKQSSLHEYILKRAEEQEAMRKHSSLHEYILKRAEEQEAMYKQPSYQEEMLRRQEEQEKVYKQVTMQKESIKQQRELDKQSGQ
jgi:hypothetical protein